MQDTTAPVARGGNLPLAVIAGAIAAVAAAIVWGAITVISGYQIGFMSIGVGFAVAYAVRFAGRGHDGRFAIASAVLALAGCLLGNYFAAAFAAAGADHASYADYAIRGLPLIVSILAHTFGPMDLVFYAIGAYFGYRYALVPLRP